MLKNSIFGLVLELDNTDLKKEGFVWVKIFWQDFRISWEDINLKNNDSLFEVIK